MVAEVVDELIASRALVFGSLPPDGRDLDLLVRPHEEARLIEGLGKLGFLAHEGTWVRFHNCTVDVVDLVPASDWSLPAEEESALFDGAKPIADFEDLVRPSPPHLLLILARRLARGAPLDEKRRRYVAGALREDPDAWTTAERIAPRWNASEALSSLRRRFESGETEDGVSTRRLRSMLSRVRRRGAVVAISGLDGAGKSSQAESLVEALQRLGFDAATEWTRLTRNRSLDLFAGPVKWLLRLRNRGRGDAPNASEGAETDAARALRSRSALVTHIWTTIVAVTNALTQRRAARRHLREGRIVVCDRYTLDSVVHLRWLYGSGKRFSVQATLIRWLSPSPVRSFFLDVPPETAYERKPDFDLDELKAQADLYRSIYEGSGAIRIEGGLPKEEICALIAREVWEALRER